MAETLREVGRHAEKQTSRLREQDRNFARGKGASEGMSDCSREKE